jgi:hypothetical protein
MPPYAHRTRRSTDLLSSPVDTLQGTTGIDMGWRQRAVSLLALTNRNSTNGPLPACKRNARKHNEMPMPAPACCATMSSARWCLTRSSRGWRRLLPLRGHSNPLLLLRVLHADMVASNATYLLGRQVDTNKSGPISSPRAAERNAPSPKSR